MRVSRLRLAQIDAAPDRANARDRTEGADELVSAQDTYLRARRDLQLAILAYLLDSGQFRLNPDGTIQLLNGMELRAADPLDYEFDEPDPDGAAGPGPAP